MPVPTLFIDHAGASLRDRDGRRFDADALAWVDGAPPTGEPVDAVAALRWLQHAAPRRCRVPVGVVGPREPTSAQATAAEAVGQRLAGLGLVVLCGGRAGVMAAVCRGVEAAGGISIGLLPDPEPTEANPHVSIALATGIGVARNAVIARAARCLVAIGGGYGTLSEIAFAMQFGRPVFTLEDAPTVAGAIQLDHVDQVENAVACAVLGI